MKSKIDVKHIAKLANLTLDETELKRFESQLSNILSYIEKLLEVKTDGVPETSQVTGLENVRRNDTPSSSLTKNQALSSAPKKHNDYFIVKGLLENND